MLSLLVLTLWYLVFCLEQYHHNDNNDTTTTTTTTTTTNNNNNNNNNKNDTCNNNNNNNSNTAKPQLRAAAMPAALGWSTPASRTFRGGAAACYGMVWCIIVWCIIV